MPEPAENVQIVLSESNFACIERATANGSPVRKAVDMASQHGRRTGDPGAGKTVVITCSEAQAAESCCASPRWSPAARRCRASRRHSLKPKRASGSPSDGHHPIARAARRGSAPP